METPVKVPVDLIALAPGIKVQPVKHANGGVGIFFHTGNPADRGQGFLVTDVATARAIRDAATVVVETLVESTITAAAAANKENKMQATTAATVKKTVRKTASAKKAKVTKKGGSKGRAYTK